MAQGKGKVSADVLTTAITVLNCHLNNFRTTKLNGTRATSIKPKKPEKGMQKIKVTMVMASRWHLKKII